MPTDTDSDGIGDWREVDSNNDGINDIVGTTFESEDTDGDGVVNDITDTDGDGIAEGVDQLDGFGTGADADLDGISNDTEGGADIDGDGLPNYLDTDSDNDGIPDSIEVGPDLTMPLDTDGDGMPDFIDTDSDNDGIDDILEGNNDFDNDGIPDYIDVDGQLETAVSGSGSIGWLFLLALTAIAVSRRRAKARVHLVSLLVIATSLNFIVAVDVQADTLCGKFVEPENRQFAYIGDDPGSYGAEFEGCWYGGLGFGYSYVSPDKEAQNFIHDTSENHDSGFNLLIGKQFSPHWFGELKYADLGEAGITNRNPAIAAAFPDAAITYRVPSLMAGYQWRVDKHLKPFAKIGLSAISNSAKGGPVPYEEQTSVQFALGLGLRLDMEEVPGSCAVTLISTTGMPGMRAFPSACSSVRRPSFDRMSHRLLHRHRHRRRLSPCPIRYPRPCPCPSRCPIRTPTAMAFLTSSTNVRTQRPGQPQTVAAVSCKPRSSCPTCVSRAIRIACVPELRAF